MKDAKEFIERLQADEAFAKEVGEKAKQMIDAGETEYTKIWIPLAAEYGYELTEEQLEEKQKQLSQELSDEELGKVSGGTLGILVVTSIVATTIGGAISLGQLFKENSIEYQGKDYFR